MELSLQGPRDNPKDSDEWKIYPSHYENKKKAVGSDFEFEKCEIPTEHEVCLNYKFTFFLHRNNN
jgi:hypothetical protein